MPIYVRGVNEFTGKVRLFIGRVPGDVVRKPNQDFAEEVIRTARPEVPVVSGRAAGSLREVATASGAIAEGGEDVAYYVYLEFGGLSGRAHATSREVYADGRYIIPAAKAIESDLVSKAEHNEDMVLRSVGLR